MKLVKAAQIGGRAKQILKLYKHYSVIGVTSRGIFLATPEKWVLFLSREQYRGPLTINLDAGSFQDGAVKKGENITLWENQLRFHKSDLRINLDGAQTWQPSLPEIDFGHKQQANLLHEIKLLGDAFLQSVLTGNHAPGADMTPLEEKLLKIERLDMERIEEILGAGSGLTPEGDDFLLGLAYLLKVHQGSDPETTAWLEELTALAFQRTTTLSANLIECAAAGQVDERIRNFVAAMSGERNILEPMQALLGWGATSGRMVLAGIIRGLDLTS